MATTATITRGKNIDNENTVTVAWTLAAGETGDAVELGAYADRSVQVTGMADTTTSIKGSNDAAGTYATLKDALGNALTFAATDLKQILQCSKKIQPVVGAGTDAAVKVTIYGVSAR